MSAVCSYCKASLVREPRIVRGGEVFCSGACASRRPSPTLALAFDEPKKEIGSFERAPGVRPMTERIAEIYTPPANVTIASAPTPALARRLRSTLRELAAADREQSAILRAVVVELLAAKDAGDWQAVATQAIELSRIANGLDALAAETEEKAT